MNPKARALLLVLFALGCQGLQGQSLENRLGYGVYGSAIKLLLGKQGDSGLSRLGGITLFYGLNRYWTLNFHGGYGVVRPRTPALADRFSTRLVPMSLGFDFTPVPFEEVRPFFTLGAGVLSWDMRQGTPEGEKSLQGVQTRPEILIGFGLQRVFADRFSASFYVRYHQILKGNEATLATGDADKGLAEIGIMITRWSRYRGDLDGDGVPISLDLCLTAVEDYDGFEDFDGCPDPDNDQDGVNDLADACRDIPEDIDGFEDWDGCPDPDNDLDGIADASDGCPNLREDLDGFEDLDGCPEIDNDLDGIPDLVDRCPNQAETRNAFEDEDGCPDTLVDLIETGRPVVLIGINFEFDSARLLSNSIEALNRTAQSLLDRPEIAVEIRGYTDSQGEADYNLRLSQRRAETVMNYLIARGIVPIRMRAIGFGESDPIASNETEEGRASNRRVEFISILQGE